MNPNSQPPRLNIKIKVFLVIFLIILGGIVFTWWQSSGKGITEEPKFGKYLHEKYGKDFVVENYRIEGSGLGMKGSPVVDAYPLDDPGLKFKVVDRGNNTFADMFAHEYWSKQGEDSLAQEISSRMSEIRSVSLSVTGGLDQNFFTIQDYPYKKSVPNFRDVLKDHSNKLNVSFGVHSATLSASNEPSSDELARAYEVIIFAKELGIESGEIAYTYTHPDYLERTDRGPVPRYNIVVPADMLDEITSPQQLEQYFKDRSSGQQG